MQILRNQTQILMLIVKTLSQLLSPYSNPPFKAHRALGRSLSTRRALLNVQLLYLWLSVLVRYPWPCGEPQCCDHLWRGLAMCALVQRLSVVCTCGESQHCMHLQGDLVFCALALASERKASCLFTCHGEGNGSDLQKLSLENLKCTQKRLLFNACVHLVPAFHQL